MGKTCKECKFFDAEANQANGKCRVRAPIVTSNGGSHFPVVAMTDWCGEHQPVQEVSGDE